eukprot:TRINITY_DN22548_c0_g1_i1.p1 TRINITY_DN22548_c0_g1~~TRINITY_DN22548_c0_g1_i1.p1  ORF type:complete len:323 (-),score=25.25 TRINITY_DN22548_c0_g1_i1:56-970(-)
MSQTSLPNMLLSFAVLIHFFLIAALLTGCGDSPSKESTTKTHPATTTEKTTTITTEKTTTTTTAVTCELSGNEATVCKVAENVTKSDENLQAAMRYVCGKVNCKACDHLQTLALATWAFNKYFHDNIAQGRNACNFSGVSILEMPSNSFCLPSEGHEKRCVPNTTNTTLLVDSLSYICGQDTVDCSPINTKGQCVFPRSQELNMMVSWAFDTYYHMNEKKQGDKACDFEGAGKLVNNSCWYQGNPQTGSGFAYQSANCSKNPRPCGCKSSKCASCALRDPSTAACEILCPWVHRPNEASAEFVL